MLSPEDVIAFKDDFAQLKQKQWITYRKRINVQSVPETFSDIIKVVKVFLYPVANAIYNNASEVTGKWKTEGYWIFD